MGYYLVTLVNIDTGAITVERVEARSAEDAQRKALAIRFHESGYTWRRIKAYRASQVEEWQSAS